MNAHVVSTYGPTAENVVGAGILPFMTRTVEGKVEIVYILGQEDFVNGWNQSGCWSGFEGGRQSGETCEQTAAREFFEETLGTIPIEGCATVEALAASLADGNYVLRIAVCRTVKPTRRDHVTYVMRVPWHDDVNQRFTAVRNPLARIHELGTSESMLRERAQQPGAAEQFREAYARKVEQVDRQLESLPAPLDAHPAIATVWDPHTGRSRRKVTRDFVEKRQVAPVTIRMIQQVIAARGMRVVPYGMRMRFAFIPVIKTANAELTKLLTREL